MKESHVPTTADEAQAENLGDMLGKGSVLISTEDIDIIARLEKAIEKLVILRSRKPVNLVLHESLDNLFKTYFCIFAPFLNGGSNIVLALGASEIDDMDKFVAKSLELEATIGALYSKFIPSGELH